MGELTATAKLIGPLPRYVLVPYQGTDYEFALGDGPMTVPDGLATFLKQYLNQQGTPAFEVTTEVALFTTLPHEMGMQLAVNLWP